MSGSIDSQDLIGFLVFGPFDQQPSFWPAGSELIIAMRRADTQAGKAWGQPSALPAT
ncbi:MULTISPECIES: hypothetical protein [Rhodopseudomonas]|uniref:hypothetical protein n=1 Tax=Rhodopseudomonas TaxID=1073 RepID=UPI0013649188|nr:MULTISPECIES: hypothetical protein [Rhodopseudomonas]MDF3812465.1 hypothetical protein [Rhodopseudomonas sp. BAL398]